jgi:hypothetical protein
MSTSRTVPGDLCAGIIDEDAWQRQMADRCNSQVLSPADPTDADRLPWHRIVDVASIAASLPWLLPGSIAALAVGTLASRALARWLGVRWITAWVVLVSFGLILAGTLSPLATGGNAGPGVARTCDLSRTWPASFSDLAPGNDVAVNLVMFFPLGCALGFAPLSRRTLLVLVGAIALPFAIEALQLEVAALGRACQGADVVDNLTGLAVGLTAGVVIAWLGSAVGRLIKPV